MRPSTVKDLTFQVCDLALPFGDKCKTLHTHPNEMLALRAPWGRWGHELQQRGHAKADLSWIQNHS